MSAVENNVFAGRRILVVEDEGIVAWWLEDLLRDLGCEVIGPAAKLEEAHQLVAQQSMDAAILDINVGGETVFPVADRLLELGIPFVFATGYGPAGLADRHRNRTVIQKPYSLETLKPILAQVLRRN